MDTDLIMVGAALAALMIGLFGWLKADNARLGDRLDERIDGLDERIGGLDERIGGLDQKINGRIDNLRQEMHQGFAEQCAETGELRERMARLEGLLAGLREAISGRTAA